MVCVWLIWRFDEKWNIITPVSNIRSDYQTYCYTLDGNDKIKIKYCELDVCKEVKEVVGLTTFKGDSINHQFFLNCPGEDDKITHGTFINFEIKKDKKNCF